MALLLLLLFDRNATTKAQKQVLEREGVSLRESRARWSAVVEFGVGAGALCVLFTWWGARLLPKRKPAAVLWVHRLPAAHSCSAAQ